MIGWVQDRGEELEERQWVEIRMPRAVGSWDNNESAKWKKGSWG